MTTMRMSENGDAVRGNGVPPPAGNWTHRWQFAMRCLHDGLCRARREPSKSAIWIGAVLLTVLAVESVRFCVVSIFDLFNPVLMSDLMAEFDLVSGRPPWFELLLAPHNEHIQATTRLVSLFDLHFLGSGFRIHQAIALASLGGVAALLGMSTLWWQDPLQSSRVPTVTRIGGCAFVIATVFAPVSIAIATYPLFMQHILATFLGSMLAVCAYAVAFGAQKGVRKFGLMAAAGILVLLLLVTNANGIVLAIAALVAPLAVARTPPRRTGRLLILCASAILIRIALGFLVPTPNLAAKLMSAEGIIAVADYYVRVIATPAYFVTAVSPARFAFAALSLAATGYATFLILNRRAFASPSLLMTVAVAVLMGHQLSIALIAVGRSQTGWLPEDPKYFYYAAMALAPVGLIILLNLTSDFARATALAAACATGFLFIAGEDYVLKSSREFYRYIEAGGLAAGMGIEDANTRNLMAWNRQFERPYAYAAGHRLNLFAREPLVLLGHDIREFHAKQDCTGAVELAEPRPARDPAHGFFLTGVAFDRVAPLDAAYIAVTDAAGKIIGVGVFASVRRDIVTTYKLRQARNAPLGWIAFGTMISEALPRGGVYLISTAAGAACRFADLPARNL